MSKLTECLCCGCPVKELIDFGDMPLVNTYAVLDKYPLSVNRCISCCHLQLDEFVDPEILYLDYAYQSGTGRTAHDYFAMFARTALEYVPNAKTVLDIASNDGSQLDAFKELGLFTYGVDPAANLNEIARSKGHTISNGFLEEYKDTRIASYDILTAQNVLAHTPTPLEFLQTCESAMADHSRLFIATSQANMIVNGECDTIYHEHVSYFNAHSMVKLAARAGLIVLDIIMHDIHGTSYVFVLGKQGLPNIRVANRLEWEFVVGLMAPPLYKWWRNNAHDKMRRVRTLIQGYKHRGYYTVGCGAAAKGISMLNMADVTLDVLADNTPTKWHKIASGMQIIPFYDIKNLVSLKNQAPVEKILFVILAWNLSQEIRMNVLKLRDNPNDIFIEAR